MKMEQAERSKTSAKKIQMPGKLLRRKHTTGVYNLKKSRSHVKILGFRRMVWSSIPRTHSCGVSCEAYCSVRVNWYTFFFLYVDKRTTIILKWWLATVWNLTSCYLCTPAVKCVLCICDNHARSWRMWRRRSLVTHLLNKQHACCNVLQLMQTTVLSWFVCKAVDKRHACRSSNWLAGGL